MAEQSAASGSQLSTAQHVGLKAHGAPDPRFALDLTHFGYAIDDYYLQLAQARLLQINEAIAIQNLALASPAPGTPAMVRTLVIPQPACLQRGRETSKTACSRWTCEVQSCHSHSVMRATVLL